MESLYFCELGAHAKFQNPRTTPSGKKVKTGEREPVTILCALLLLRQMLSLTRLLIHAILFTNTANIGIIIFMFLLFSWYFKFYLVIVFKQGFAHKFDGNLETIGYSIKIFLPRPLPKG